MEDKQDSITKYIKQTVEDSISDIPKNQKYDIDKYYRIMNNTQSNYSYAIKRLTRKARTSNFVLIYYSIFLIIYALTIKFFPAYFHDSISSYFNIILSIIVLVYSLINNSAMYTIRISKMQESLNIVKCLKRNIYINDFDKSKSEYEELIKRSEPTIDTDFFYTTKHLCIEYNLNWITGKDKKQIEKKGNDESETKCRNESTEDLIRKKEIRGYISELGTFSQITKIIGEYLFLILLFLTPIIIFALCIVAKIYNFPPV